ncbi:MAG: DNA-3-methyladenine glycosylase [Opitutaceae bacterium]
MGRVIEAKEFESQKTVALARWLIGKLLVRRGVNGEVRRHRILETEAYDGERDLACHAARGRTERTDVMYGAAGFWYVYLCYGRHEMLNLVAGPEGWPAAVLIRGVEGASGPGRLTRLLGIDRELNRTAAAVGTGLWIEDDGFWPPPRSMARGPRVGVDYAGPRWSQMPWRFCLVAPPGDWAGANSTPQVRRRISRRRS